ncbi:Brain/reproductive organ-expressed protein [Cynara cardunculus var. scolymus]|uniref:BRISC and BRCA1-A complex member 2 n=1 Tax=Cynara cardunculus var. scolymus TaxID=59895 RepID=A0A118K4Y5_CYNCS|nr:Brain/reproductive organ-expressed protein [Cynara cardunculus var. scolymus]
MLQIRLGFQSRTSFPDGPQEEYVLEFSRIILQIRWDVIYNAQFLLLAPDIVFGPEDDNFRPYHACGEGDLKPKNSLSDWNCKDPTRLLSLILELMYLPPYRLCLLCRSLYMAYQKKRVGEVDDERLKFEINTIYSREVIFQCINLNVTWISLFVFFLDDCPGRKEEGAINDDDISTHEDEGVDDSCNGNDN